MSSQQVYALRKWLLSSPPAEWILNQLRTRLIDSLKQGPIPKHVAFVMDGNRRYARNHRLETVEGHHLGFEALARILEVCYKSGVTHVTIYAFSIENFKRSKHEVDALMEMAIIKLRQLSQHGELLDRYGARIRILGQREFIRPDVLEAVHRAEEVTAHNSRVALNVCFPYTSREEITTAVRNTVKEYSQPIAQPEPDHARRNLFKDDRIADTIRSQNLTAHEDEQQQPDQQPSHHSPSSSTASFSSEHEDSGSVSSSTTLHQSTPSSPPSSKPLQQTTSTKPTSLSSTSPLYRSPELITPKAITSHLLTADSPPLDLLVRTSGVGRLSDFMLWQCHQDTTIVFLDVLWPEFDLWSFLPVLWEWQWRRRKSSVQSAEAIENGSVLRTGHVKIA